MGALSVTRPLLAAIYATACAAACAQEASTIDRVWSGHPVGFAVLAERGHQFVAYYDANRRLTVAQRKDGDKEWQHFKLPGIPVPGTRRASNVTGWDSHNYLALALDREGYLHLAGNMHVNPLVYYRSTKKLDAASLERLDRMTGENETRCTYPLFFKNAEGDLVFRYRDGGSGNGNDIYNAYDAKARSWRRLVGTPILDGEGRRNAYALKPVLGPDGLFHLAWMWRETPDCTTNHTLSYARSRDLVHWEDSRGRPIALPITESRGEVVDAAKPGAGLINMSFNLGFDAKKRPVVTYHRYDKDGRSQVFAAWPNAEGGWDARPITDWNFRWEFSGGGSIAPDVLVGAVKPGPQGTLSVDVASRAAGDSRMLLDADTLAPVAKKPAAPGALPEELARARDGMEVSTATARSGGKRHVLRWETLPRNRDLPRAHAPEPTELQLYEFPDAPTLDASRVGS